MYLFKVLIIRIIVFGGPYWDPPTSYPGSSPMTMLSLLKMPRDIAILFEIISPKVLQNARGC